MAFMGMIFGALFIVILVTIICVVGVCLLIGIICKIVGKVKDIKGARIAGTVFFIIALVVIVPVIALFAWGYFKTAFTEVHMPDGSTEKVYYKTVNRFRDNLIGYIDTGDEEFFTNLGSMIDDDEALLYYRDNNHRSILEYGMDAGNAELVEFALERGAEVDSPERFEYMAYVECTWDEYLDMVAARPVTEGDVRIAQMFFDADAETKFDTGVPYYSNIFGKAAWAILYNDDTVTDTEMEFLQVIIDNGFDHDACLMPVYDAPSNYYFGPETHQDVARDDNYYEVWELAGKPV
ncbi:MAG: hypothetical protein K6F79_03700 [Saccharofermentans sp.]|nr:hypothetical protein [Saccharofermentans sp.]